MAYIKFKELSKYFDFKLEVDVNTLPDYAKEYVEDFEEIIASYKNSKDYVVFTNKKRFYKSISTSAMNYKPGKVELLFSFDSGYQLHINFIDMNHDKKENIKKTYKIIMKECL